MDRQPSARIATNRPPTAVPIPRTQMSAASRPITQQGLSGLRPAQTAGAGSNRIYRDKRYYISRIQSHMNAIREEIGRLNKSSLDFRVASINRSEMRKSAENSAKTLSEKQEMLTVYNTALDMHLSKTKTEEIVAETAELKQKNDFLLKELDSVFQKKLKKEEEIGDLQRKISEEEEFVKSLIEKLSPESREKYFNLAEENRKVLESIAGMQEKIRESKEKIERCRVNIAQSNSKQKKLQLLRNLSKLGSQREDLENFVQNTLTPAQQREKLLEQVKQDKADIESLLKVKDNIEQEVAANEIRLADLEHELDGKDNARLKKHKELRERGDHMEKFILEYEDKSSDLKVKIKDVNREICYALDHFSENLAETNLRELDLKFDGSEQTDAEGWSKKLKLLTTQINRINSVRQKYEAEMTSMRSKMEKMREELKLYSDVEKGKEELETKKFEMLETQTTLKNTLESTKGAVVEAQRKREDLRRRIEENEDYVEIMRIENEVEERRKENEELEGLVEQEGSCEEMVEVLGKLDEALKRRNLQLIEQLKNKF